MDPADCIYRLHSIPKNLILTRNSILPSLYNYLSFLRLQPRNSNSIMPHATATFNGQVIAEADTYEFVEGNVYFPPDSIKDKGVFSANDLTTVCS